ncbi:MAG: hypothetical protein K5989_05335 [Lachnospiraceae bacterium]|nr:hypothetical protein [Lachnospiraceae bacterium]
MPGEEFKEKTIADNQVFQTERQIVETHQEQQGFLNDQNAVQQSLLDNQNAENQTMDIKKLLEKKRLMNDSILKKLKTDEYKNGVERYEGWVNDQKILRSNRIFILKEDNKWYGQDSPEMVRVKNDLKALNSILAGQYTEQALNEVSAAYRNAIDACQLYIQNKNPYFAAGRRRLAQVKDLLRQIKDEQQRFEQGTSMLNNAHDLKTFNDILDLEGKAYKQPLDVQAENKLKEGIDELSDFLPLMKKDKSLISDKVDGETYWKQLNEAGARMISGWGTKSDRQRGRDMADVLFSANKILSKKEYGSNSRNTAAKRLKNFVAETLSTMSMNCRTLALEQIFKKEDAFEKDKSTTPEMKKLNNEFFMDMARAEYKKSHPDVDLDDMLTDENYRNIYMNERIKEEGIAFDSVFKDNELYNKANAKFPLARWKSEGLLCTPVRRDRYGDVIEEDKGAVKEWEALFTKLANAKAEDIKEIGSDYIKRTLNTDPTILMDDEWRRKHPYEADSIKMRFLTVQNIYTSWVGELGTEARKYFEETQKNDRLDKLDKFIFAFQNYQQSDELFTHGMMKGKPDETLIEDLRNYRELKKKGNEKAEFEPSSSSINHLFFTGETKNLGKLPFAPKEESFLLESIKSMEEAGEGDVFFQTEYYRKECLEQLKKLE